MNCNNCPYNEKYYREEISDNKCIANNIWCDKVGGKIEDYGCCYEDFNDNNIENKSSRKKKRNRRERDLKHKKHIAFLCDIVGCAAWNVDEIKFKGRWIENPKPYYKRYYRGKRSKYLKKQANRKIRRCDGDLHNGYQHIHKVFDFWWEYD